MKAFLERKEQNQNEQVCKPASLSTGDVDLDLKSFIVKEVQCVDFHITNGQPELDLELSSGETVRKPIDVLKPSVTVANVCASKVMSADELLDMDDIEFQLHDYDNSPAWSFIKKQWFCYLDAYCYLNKI